MSKERSACACGPAPRLIFACSGAADVGAVADQAADGILAIDGCSLDCVKKSLELAGFNEFEHLRVTDLGMTKGATDINEANIATVAMAGAAKLA